MAAVWQMEQMVVLDGSATSTLATRNSFLGLKSGMGTVLMGRHDTPYKMATRKLDVFADGLADNRALMGGVTGVSAAASFDGRQPDVLAYVSPTFANITAVIARVNLSESRTVSGSPSAHAISLAGMYNAGPIYASLAYEAHNFKGPAPAGTENSETALKVGFGYTVDAFSVGVAVEQTDDDFGAAKASVFGHQGIYVGGKYNLASGAVKVAYTQAGKLGDGAAATDTEATQLSLGYDHNLSKRTTAYVSYTMVTNKKKVGYGLAATSSATGTVTGLGADPSALSLGIKHSF
jgi:predicted porin